MTKFVSIFDEKPNKRGWYPALHCWDIGEGFFTSAVYWDGEFKRDLPISHFINKKFNSESDALKYAKKNDPDW